MQSPSPRLLGSLSLAPAGLASAMVIILLGVAVPRLAAQSDDFNDGNDTGWTHYSITGFYNPAFPGMVIVRMAERLTPSRMTTAGAKPTISMRRRPFFHRPELMPMVCRTPGGELPGDAHLHHPLFRRNGLAGLEHDRAPHGRVLVVHA